MQYMSLSCVDWFDRHTVVPFVTLCFLSPTDSSYPTHITIAYCDAETYNVRCRHNGLRLARSSSPSSPLNGSVRRAAVTRSSTCISSELYRLPSGLHRVIKLVHFMCLLGVQCRRPHLPTRAPSNVRVPAPIPWQLFHEPLKGQSRVRII